MTWADSLMFRTTRSRVWLCIALVSTALTISTRDVVLRGVGAFLAASDPLERVDLAVMTIESGDAGKLELSELFRAKLADRVALFAVPPTRVQRELERRGVRLHDERAETLVQLGIPMTAIVTIPTGEIGTTEGTAALARWCREHSVAKVLVVVSPTHGRRYRRALHRAWSGATPLPLVRVTRFDLLLADDWWRARTTRREGIIELQKLTLDFLVHPP